MESGKVVKGVVLACCFWSGAVGAETAEHLLAQGNRYWAEQKLELAEQQFRAAISMAPDSPQAQQRLAAFYLSQNRNREAIEAYQTAITLQPENPALFVAICLAYLHEGAYRASQAMCSHALALDPDSKNARQLQHYIDTKLRAENNQLLDSRPPVE